MEVGGCVQPACWDGMDSDMPYLQKMLQLVMGRDDHAPYGNISRHSLTNYWHLHNTNVFHYRTIAASFRSDQKSSVTNKWCLQGKW